MFSNRKRVFIFLFVLLLTFSGAFFTYTYTKDHKEKETANHSLKIVYPDTKQAAEMVFLSSPQDLHRSDENLNYESETEIENDKQLHEKIEQIIKNNRLEGALVGISVRKATTGELIYSNHGDIRLRPASNMKLLTAIAALETLGEEYRFTTEIRADGVIENNVLDGNIYMIGKGDPTLLKKDLDQFAEELHRLGIHEIKGNIIGDDTWYDDIRYSQDLNWSNEYNYTGAAVSALTISPNEDYDAGTVVIRVYPNEEIGKPPSVVVIPETDYITIENKAKTARKGEAKGLIIDRIHGTNNILIDGSISINTPIEAWRSVWEPTYFALDLFHDSLIEKGIKLSDQTKIKRGEVPKDSELLTTRKSMPLKDLLIPFMKLSNNGHGETLVKEMGRVIYNDGSWDSGLKVMEEQLAKYGVNTKTISLRDGSGMSFKNLIPPNELTKLLFEVQDAKWFESFFDSQPIAGDPNRMLGGTLGYRMLNESTKGKVWAKTGSLTGVSTLSGYLMTTENELLIFSIMMNNYVEGWMPGVQDIMVKVFAEHDYK